MKFQHQGFTGHLVAQPPLFGTEHLDTRRNTFGRLFPGVPIIRRAPP
jgi:hypothetical protein